jgi:hypothetical protein
VIDLDADATDTTQWALRTSRSPWRAQLARTLGNELGRTNPLAAELFFPASFKRPAVPSMLFRYGAALV